MTLNPTSSPAAAASPYRGPCYEIRDDGSRVVPLGSRLAQPGERLDWVAVDHAGACGGLVTGAPGSGRSSCLEAVALGLARSGEWTTWYSDGDPDAGSSSPLLCALARWVEVGAGGVLAQLTVIEDTMRARAAALAAAAAPGWASAGPGRVVPSRRTPGLLWVIDELHQLTADPQLKQEGFTGRLERVVRTGRKYGIVVAAGAASLHAQAFGGSTTLRAYLGTTNRLVFRDPGDHWPVVLGGQEIVPSEVPDGGGYCHVAGRARPGLARTAWTPDLQRRAAELAADGAAALLFETPAVCRECGCSDDQACVDERGTACAWAGPGLCTRCAGPGAGPGESEERA